MMVLLSAIFLLLALGLLATLAAIGFQAAFVLLVIGAFIALAVIGGGLRTRRR